jgi:hypothetical protein
MAILETLRSQRSKAGRWLINGRHLLALHISVVKTTNGNMQGEENMTQRIVGMISEVFHFIGMQSHGRIA